MIQRYALDDLKRNEQEIESLITFKRAGTSSNIHRFFIRTKAKMSEQKQVQAMEWGRMDHAGIVRWMNCVPQKFPMARASIMVVVWPCMTLHCLVWPCIDLCGLVLTCVALYDFLRYFAVIFGLVICSIVTLYCLFSNS